MSQTRHLTHALGCIALALLLAGCTSAGGPSGAPLGKGSEISPLATAGKSTEVVEGDAGVGTVAGTIVDDAQLPIGNVTIELDDGAHSTKSLNDGNFLLSYVPVGIHNLRAFRDGYVNHTSRVTVAMDEETRVTITLVPAASADEYIETKVQSGMVVCALGVRTPAGAPTEQITPCNAAGVDKLKLTWPVPSWGNITGVWVDTTWTSTQATGNAMSLNWWVLVPDGGLRGSLGRYNGVDPLSRGFSRQAIEDFYILATKKGLDQCDREGSKCGIESWHSNSPSILGPSSPVDASVMINQAFDEYVTFFHRVPFPTSFSALPPE